MEKKYSDALIAVRYINMRMSLNEPLNKRSPHTPSQADSRKGRTKQCRLLASNSREMTVCGRRLLTLTST